MSQPIDLVGDPAAQLLRQQALADLRALATQLRGAWASAIQASDAIPCDGHVDWLGPASDAFRQRGRDIREALQPAIDDLRIAIATIDAEAW